MARGRGAVVHLDRSQKAQQVNAIVSDGLGRAVEGLRILDIGSGNGDISEFFATANSVASVDVEDKRRGQGKAEFTKVDSETLPFDDDTFDIVLSHHVIEHVSDHDRHLREMARVAKRDGLVYLATPNKSSPIMEGHVGNDMVLRYRQMEPLFERNGFVAEQYGWRMVRSPDTFHAEQRFGRFLPTPLVKALRPLFPSHSFILRQR